jgi:hypothetical protein
MASTAYLTLAAILKKIIMRTVTLFFFGLLFISSCREVNNNGNSSQDEAVSYQMDTNIIVLPYVGSKSCILSLQEIITVDSLIGKCIEQYNREQEEEFAKINAEHPEYRLDKKSFVIDFKTYKRQYVPEINASGEKEVKVNCACDGTFGLVEDGGNCYFQLKVNLFKKTYFGLSANGNA